MSDVLAFSIGELVIYTSDLTGEQYEAKVIYIEPGHAVGRPYLVRPTAWNIRWNAWARPDQLRPAPASKKGSE